MIEFFKGLLSSDKIIEAGVKAGDKLVYTDEEKAESTERYDELRLEFAKSTLPFERTRRFIAIAITLAWVVTGGLCMLAAMTEIGLAWYTIYHPEMKYPPMFKPLSDFGMWYVVPSFITLKGFYFYSRMKK